MVAFPALLAFLAFCGAGLILVERISIFSACFVVLDKVDLFGAVQAFVSVAVTSLGRSLYLFDLLLASFSRATNFDELVEIWVVVD